MPGVVGFLDEYARMAVQGLPLVVSGFLFMASSAWSPVALPICCVQRYTCLVVPLLRPSCCWPSPARPRRGGWITARSPTCPVDQLSPAMLLLHDLLDQGALSAGVWYVAIDFQLFALAILLLGCPGGVARPPAPAGAGPRRRDDLAALFGFNRDSLLGRNRPSTSSALRPWHPAGWPIQPAWAGLWMGS